MTRLEDKTAIITGGSSGINKGIALRFADEGANIAIASIDSDEMLEAAAATVRQRGAKVFATRCDVGNREDISGLVDRAVEEFGGADILVNGAAYMITQHNFEDYTLDDYERSIRVGLDSAFHAMQLVYPHMRKRGGGKILNFASIGGIRGVKGSGGYAAAKTGLIGLTRSAANEWAQYGINVNAIAPMAMSGAWSAYMETLPPGTNPFDALGTRRNAVGRAGDPERDVGPAAAFLCSSDADYITGHILPVDGGLLELE